MLKLVARHCRRPSSGWSQALQLSAAHERVSRVAIRCQTEFTHAYLRLIELGYRVHWTDLRMLLQGYPQRIARARAS